MIDRRHVFVAGIACWLPNLVAQPIDAPKPYLQVPTLAGDGRLIRVFFSPSCPYSRMYVPFFRNLAATLPADRKLVYTPVVNKGDGISYALAFAAVERFYPSVVDQFIEASMVASQDKGIATTNWAGLERIGRAAGVRESLPFLIHKHASMVQNDVNRYVQVRHSLQVVNTPAVAVAGTYVVTPEITKGDAALFSQLVNGIISMAR
jgi:protein dithiol oxidoreductase (disulfide-forming)